MSDFCSGSLELITLNDGDDPNVKYFKSYMHPMLGAELQDFDSNRLYERVRVMIQGLILER